MTLHEKQEYLDNFCDEQFDLDNRECEGCPYNHPDAWCHVGGAYDVTEEEIDSILAKIQFHPQANDVINHPNHYTNGGMECIDEMIEVFGKLVVADFCLCNVWKYRYRALTKNGQEDIDKSHWYMKKYLELRGEPYERHI